LKAQQKKKKKKPEVAYDVEKFGHDLFLGGRGKKNKKKGNMSPYAENATVEGGSGGAGGTKTQRKKIRKKK